MKDTPISRRDFLKNMGIAGAGAFLAASPWLSAFSEVTNTSSEKCRLAIIGPGSRGRFLMSFLVKNPKVDIVALCDIYQPSIDEALKLAPKAKVYGNYKEVLEDKNIDAVLVATPLSAHYSAKSQSVIRWKSVTIYIKSIAAPEKFSSPDSNVSLIRAISRRWK